MLCGGPSTKISERGEGSFSIVVHEGEGGGLAQIFPGTTLSSFPLFEYICQGSTVNINLLILPVWGPSSDFRL